jgi:hypothetical protein
MPKFMVPFVEKVVDVIGDGHCGFQAIAEFLGLTEESHIMIRGHLIQELKDHINGLHPPTNSGGNALLGKWLTFPDMRHIVANYYNRCVVLLTNHEIGTSESFFPLRGQPPAKQKTPIMCLGLIPNHFVLIFFEGWLPTTSIIYEMEQS